MSSSKDILLGRLRSGESLSGGQQVKLTLLLAVPAILAQLSSVLMQYIDSAMVGRLGSNQAASIGLVSTCTWLFNGFSMAVMTGFTVQVAHACGARNFDKAKNLLRQGLTAVLIFSVLLGLTGIGISGPLPLWLGGSEAIHADASGYFSIYALFFPISMTGYAAAAMLQASGNMKVPSIIYICMCGLDVVFNYIFIYVLGLGVIGAAWGTGVAETLSSAFAVWYACTQSRELKLKGTRGSFLPSRDVLSAAFRITGPLWIQNVVMRGAYVISTLIVAPLGPVSIAANSFAITAESFCYMPGFGLEEASTTLVGQSLGARRVPLAKRFAWITIGMAMALMSVLAVAMYAFAPQMMGIMSVDPEVVSLGARVLRIEAFAEAFYAAAIVGVGVCAGAGNTTVPTVLNLATMWVLRIGLALILTPRMGLVGYWIAMCIELSLRGILFLIYVRSGHWMKRWLVSDPT